jgi:hypothetical protein
VTSSIRFIHSLTSTSERLRRVVPAWEPMSSTPRYPASVALARAAGACLRRHHLPGVETGRDIHRGEHDDARGYTSATVVSEALRMASTVIAVRVGRVRIRPPHPIASIVTLDCDPRL